VPQILVTESMIDGQPQTRRQRLALAVVALTLGIIGQLFWARTGYFGEGLALTAAGVVVFLALAAWRDGIWLRLRSVISLAQSSPQRVVLLLLACGVGLLEIRLLRTHPVGGDYWSVFVLWIASIAMYL
jgi:hypothetical protein